MTRGAEAGERESRAKECQGPQVSSRSRGGKARVFPAGSRGSTALPTLVWDFQPPELRQNTFLECEATLFMVV